MSEPAEASEKQERTPTWYGLFVESGEATETVDVMQEIWTGEIPSNRAPRLKSLWLNGQSAHESVELRPGKSYPAKVEVVDSEGDSLRFEWQLRSESTATQVGGDSEAIPPLINGAVKNRNAPEANVKAPDQPGAYRLFVYVYDGQGQAAHANIPFLVRP